MMKPPKSLRASIWSKNLKPPLVALASTAIDVIMYKRRIAKSHPEQPRKIPVSNTACIPGFHLAPKGSHVTCQVEQTGSGDMKNLILKQQGLTTIFLVKINNQNLSLILQVKDLNK